MPGQGVVMLLLEHTQPQLALWNIHPILLELDHALMKPNTFGLPATPKFT